MFQMKCASSHYIRNPHVAASLLAAAAAAVIKVKQMKS